jgi:mono/diheme cytochrome c family protein
MKNANRITIGLMIAAVSIVTLTIQRSGQSQGQATNRGLGGLKTKPPVQTPRPSPQDPEDFSKNTWNIPADADKTKNPVDATAESIAKGKEHFLTRSGNCVFCHGETGAGNEENMPRLRRKPADLSDKERMSKISDGEIFWKISTGIPGIMPARDKHLTEEDRWHVVNYVRTLAKEKEAN